MPASQPASQPATKFFFNSNSSLDYLKQGHLLGELGGYGVSQGESQHINIPTLIGNDYNVGSNHGGNVLVGLGYEHLWNRVKEVDVSYGLSLYYLAPSKVQGNILVESQLNNFTYSYELSHLPLYAMLKGSKTLSNPRYEILADVGIGPNFMFMSSYQEQPLLSNLVPNDAFTSTTNTTFSVTAGLSVEIKNVVKEYPLRCGYRFYYLGEGSLNHNTKVTDNLSTGSSYANAGVCSMVF